MSLRLSPLRRLTQCRTHVFILGITGQIATGKSTLCRDIARALPARKVAIFDADKCVHQMYDEPGGEAARMLARHFPQAVESGTVNRRELGRIVFCCDAKRALLNSIIHPIVQRKRIDYARLMLRRNISLLIWDIPLLFETDADKYCTATIVTYCNAALQQSRMLRRNKILGREVGKQEVASQVQQANNAHMPLYEKLKRADYHVNTGTRVNIKSLSMRINCLK